jgi:hypothetical protein
MPAIAPSETERLAELEREFIRVLKITLSKLGAETDLADLYYSRLRTASPDERLLALHDNPLEVASVLAGVPLTKSAFDREDSVRDKSQGDRPTDRRLLSTAIITDLRVGESLVGDGYEVAHIDLIMGPRGTAAEKAFANCLTNNKDGFTSLLAVVAPNLMVKPATVMFNKVTIKNAKQAVQLFGPAQHAVAKFDCRQRRRGRHSSGRGRKPVHLRRRLHSLGSNGRQKDSGFQLSGHERGDCASRKGGAERHRSRRKTQSGQAPLRRLNGRRASHLRHG